MTPIDRAKIDKGVRLLVCWLRCWGFETTDSGDGSRCTSHDIARAGTRHLHAHVHIRSTPASLHDDARTLYHHLLTAELKPGLAGAPGVTLTPGTIQATYDPTDDSAVLSLYGVTDAMLMASSWASQVLLCGPHGDRFCEVCSAEMDALTKALDEEAGREELADIMGKIGALYPGAVT